MPAGETDISLTAFEQFAFENGEMPALLRDAQFAVVQRNMAFLREFREPSGASELPNPELPEDAKAALRKAPHEYRFTFSGSILGQEWTGERRLLPLSGENGSLGYIEVFISRNKRGYDREQLVKSEEKFRELADNISEIFWISENDQIIYVSPAFERIFRQTAEELYDNPLSFLRRVDERDRFRILRAVRSDGYSVHRKFFEEFRVNTTDGRERWIWARSFLSSRAGGVIRSVGIAEDITIRKEAEKQIQESLEKSEQLNILKSRFISMASHEFRTPLSVIMSSVEMLKDFNDRMTPEQRDAQFNDIENSINAFVELLDDVIAINKAELGRFDGKFEEIELNSFIRKILKEETAKMERFPQLNLVPDPEEKTYRCCKKTLKHICANLVSNALKYTPPQKHVTITYALNARNFIFSVTDEGIGIPEEELQRIFDPFTRASNTGAVGGTGLGLSIARRMAGILGGEITCQSKADAGSTFTLSLPAVIQEGTV